MKKIYPALIGLIISCNSIYSQIRIQQKTISPVPEKPVVANKILNNSNTTNKLLTKPGTFMENTPVIIAPANTNGNSVSFSSNSIGGALNDAADTKYYLFDGDKNGKDKLLAINANSTRNDLRRLDKNAAGTIAQVGGYMFPSGINITDDIYFGEFSPENGNTILVNDKRSNQFWHYQHNSTNYMMFERPYPMISNWVVAGKYLTGDFNGDGKTDLLAWDQNKNEFQVALHTKNPLALLGQASLQPAGVWLSGWAQTADMNIVTGDFNGDKKDDIAIVHQPTGEWWVALSTGTGFQPSAGYRSGVWLKPWAIGAQHKIFAIDVNNDGKCDLVDYDNNEKSFQAVLSNGQYFDYFFKKELISSSIANPGQVAFGKFGGNCIVAVGHLLPPDAQFAAARRAVSIYLANYKRL